MITKNNKMKLEKLSDLTQDEIYSLITNERINANYPTERDDRDFPIGARAYVWPNEGLCDLKKLDLNLNGKDMLIVGASGDPFAVFAYLGAETQVGFDTSHRAILWSELKLKALKELNWGEFKQFTCLNTSEKPESYYDRLKDGLSEYARTIFDPLFEEHGTLNGIRENTKFFRRGSYAHYLPECNVYTENKKNYERARKRLNETIQILVPGSLETIAKITKEKFDGFYGSNIMDHFKDREGQIDTSEKTARDFLAGVDSHLKENSTIILQFEWSDIVRDNALRVLKRRGYKIRSPETSSGLGRLSIAERK